MIRFPIRALAAAGTGLAAGLAMALPLPVFAIDFNEVPLGTHGHELTSLAEGAKGTFWYTDRISSIVGRVDPDGTVTEFDLASLVGRDAQPWTITTGPDGNLWVGADSAGLVQMSPAGDVLKVVRIHNPKSLTTGSDGRLWMIEGSYAIVRYYTATGEIVEYQRDDNVNGITSGPDGALWFTEERLDGSGNGIGRITTDGAVSVYPIANDRAPALIVTGPDGALWFSEDRGDRLGRLTTDGEYTEHLGSNGMIISGLASGSDGNLWLTRHVRLDDQGPGQLLRRQGDIETVYEPPHNVTPAHLTAASSGQLAFLENRYSFNPSQFYLVTFDPNQP